MVAAELRGGGKPKLNEALGWIGSRVDDIYGAGVGRLEDVWIDPGTGVPRWLLVKEGRFGGRTTLIPFEDATAGAGHVWVPYERDVVRAAPEIEPGAPLTQHVEAALRTHYAASLPSSISYEAGGRAASEPPVEPATVGRQRGSSIGTATIRFQPPVESGPPQFFSARRSERERHGPPQRPVIRGPEIAREGEDPGFTPRLPERPPPPIAVPEPQQQAAGAWDPPRQRYPQQPQGRPLAQPPPEPSYPPQPQGPRAGYAPAQGYAPADEPQFVGGWQQPTADPAQGPVEQLRALAEAGGSHYVEIELSGELTIRGELRTVRVTPRDGDEYGRR